MRKINRIAWMVIAVACFITGTWVWISEGFVHSNFYSLYILGAICLALWYFEGKQKGKSVKPKKRR